MTATGEVAPPRRSKGFTIDSIMGNDTDSQTTNKRPSSPDDVHDDKNTKYSRISVCSKDSDSDYESRSMKRLHDDSLLHKTSVHDNVLHKKTSPGMPSIPSELDSSILHRTSSLHRDSMRDFNFSSANIREGVRTVSSPETLRHLHETLLHNSGMTPGSGGVHLNPLDAHRQFRHPLSPVNMPGYPPQMPMGPQVHPMLMNGGRDLRHMYPYIADRYPGCFLPRFGMGGMPGLFFQPYRKPKRIRTAFSPSQLLQLEKSFEKSHYVVGQERKDLASELQLTETQVKVWFQNRRTKYKRTKSEEGGPDGDHDGRLDDSKSESDISDIEDIDDVDNNYTTHAQYHHVIQTC